ncbi:hypothetical protein PVK06_008952 [Gossypium arboreum]|uniref:Retrotransposon gag domain-containing protein n=1 Tax=Gossypium arboreum TaxID=29729 RepID=A0ABR0QL99_GOSAR|nr:hypothetical protein PVK06_008952 [Gossypium arboreum]
MLGKCGRGSSKIRENVDGMETRGRARKASRSRDILSALEDRVVTLEEFVRDVKERVDDIDDKVNDGDNAIETMMVGKTDAMEAMITALKEEIAELKGELTIYKAALGNGGLAAVTPTPSVHVPKPKEFKGTRSAREVDNFLWGVKQYFRANDIADYATKVITAAMYLTDIALLWWRRRSTDVRRGGTEIGTWKEFQYEFKAQFYHEYAEDEARAKLRRLSQQGTVKEYVQEFSELMLQISDMESLVEFGGKKDKPESFKPKSQPKGNSGGDKERPPRNDNGKKPWDKRNSGPIRCFHCDGPHMIKDCPKKAALSAVEAKSESVTALF